MEWWTGLRLEQNLNLNKVKECWYDYSSHKQQRFLLFREKRNINTESQQFKLLMENALNCNNSGPKTMVQSLVEIRMVLETDKSHN
ncbi:hypothetical protein KUTeg_008968 [Tegillarca granosa]|uniref:Uncharacterized protein n=1 Tax=Tegillarca granosa TaxID=220873 RepID=A0ABQ9FB60_TEGGR|nr:hypothetical protein KUTeg_008968 [Tegillarca granosa]